MIALQMGAQPYFSSKSFLDWTLPSMFHDSTGVNVLYSLQELKHFVGFSPNMAALQHFSGEPFPSQISTQGSRSERPSGKKSC